MNACRHSAEENQKRDTLSGRSISSGLDATSRTIDTASHRKHIETEFAYHTPKLAATRMSCCVLGADGAATTITLDS